MSSRSVEVLDKAYHSNLQMVEGFLAALDDTPPVPEPRVNRDGGSDIVVEMPPNAEAVNGKGSPPKKVQRAFKEKVVKSLRSEGLSAAEAARRIEVQNKTQVSRRERIYLEEGVESLHVERRGRTSGINGT